MRHDGRVIWITGRPAAGKSTLAKGLLQALEARGTVTLWLDSDDLRDVITPNPTYTDAERDQFYRAVAHIARRAAEGGATVVISATGSKRTYRDELRRAMSRFTEVWLTCEREELRRRDIKGLYAKSQTGEIDNLPGVGAAYESPVNAEVVLDTGKVSPQDGVEAVLRHLGLR